MTVVVGIFDNESKLNAALRKLIDEGFDDTVFDQGIVSQEMSARAETPSLPGINSAVLGPVRTPHSSLPGSDREAVVEAFKRHLSDYKLPDELIESYATTFIHGGKFVIVRTGKKRAQEATELLKRSDVEQVNQHG